MFPVILIGALCFVKAGASESLSDEKVLCNIANFHWSYFKRSLRVCEIKNQPITADDVVIESPRDLAVQGVTIRNNKLVKFLPENFGAVFPELLAIDVRNCAVQIIDGAFTILRKLKRLNLPSNEIAIIVDDAFVDLEKLEFLNLDHNKMDFLHENIFDSLANLKNISLDFNNLVEIPKDLFRYNENLEYIWLTGNKIKLISVQAFDRLVNLKFLNLKENVCVDMFFDFSEFSFDFVSQLGKAFSRNCLKIDDQQVLDEIRKMQGTIKEFMFKELRSMRLTVQKDVETLKLQRRIEELNADLRKYKKRADSCID